MPFFSVLIPIVSHPTIFLLISIRGGVFGQFLRTLSDALTVHGWLQEAITRANLHQWVHKVLTHPSKNVTGVLPPFIHFPLKILTLRGRKTAHLK